MAKNGTRVVLPQEYQGGWQCGQEETGDVFAEEDDKVRSKHESCKLKWAGKRGADEYKKGMQKEGVTVRLKTIRRHSRSGKMQ